MGKENSLSIFTPYPQIIYNHKLEVIFRVNNSIPLSKDPEKRRKHLEAISGKNHYLFGKHLSEEAKKKLSLNNSMHDPLARKKVSDYAKENNVGENNNNFKGDKAGYDAIHLWIKKRKPNGGICEVCGSTEKKLILACIGEYKRDPDQFSWMCWSCHSKHDKRNPRHPEKYFPDMFTEKGTKKR